MFSSGLHAFSSRFFTFSRINMFSSSFYRLFYYLKKIIFIHLVLSRFYSFSSSTRLRNVPVDWPSAVSCFAPNVIFGRTMFSRLTHKLHCYHFPKCDLFDNITNQFGL